MSSDGDNLPPEVKAERRVTVLEAEKEKLDNQITVETQNLVEQVTTIKGNIPLAKYGVYKEHDTLAEAIATKITELKDQRKEVVRHLGIERETLKEKEQQLTMTMAAQQQQGGHWPPSSVTSPKRLASQEDFETPDGKRNRAASSWKYSAAITNAMDASRFRKNVYLTAQDYIAYKGVIEYTTKNLPPQCTSLLNIDLLFKSEDWALKFDTALHELVRVYNNDRLRFFLQPSINECASSCNNRLYMEADYNQTDSPNRNTENIISPPKSDVSTTVLPEEVVRHESIVDPGTYRVGAPAQWCHVLANVSRRDERNRLVMCIGLHEYYDAKHSAGDRGIPNMSVFCAADDLPLEDSPDYQDVTLNIVFGDVQLANGERWRLRNPLVVAPTQVTVTIQKKQARSFVTDFLNPRHEANISRNPNLSDRLQCLHLQGASDVAVLGDTLDEQLGDDI